MMFSPEKSRRWKEFGMIENEKRLKKKILRKKSRRSLPLKS